VWKTSGALTYRPVISETLRRPEGADDGVTGEVEAVGAYDQPPLVLERAGAELGEALGSRGSTKSTSPTSGSSRNLDFATDLLLLWDAGVAGGPLLSTWLIGHPSLPHGRAEAEYHHLNFYDAWVNLQAKGH